MVGGWIYCFQVVIDFRLVIDLPTALWNLWTEGVFVSITDAADTDDTLILILFTGYRLPTC